MIKQNHILYDNKRLLLCNTYPTTAYDPASGFFYRLDSTNQVTRKLLPDEDGFILVYLSSGTKTKRRPLKLAWEIVNNKLLPDGYVVYPKNMNPEDLTAFNLGALHKEEYKKLKDSVQNLEGALKLKPDPDKPHGVILMYYSNGRRIKQYFEDIVTAKREKNKILVYCAKLVSKYTITE